MRCQPRHGIARNTLAPAGGGTIASGSQSTRPFLFGPVEADLGLCSRPKLSVQLRHLLGEARLRNRLFEGETVDRARPLWRATEIAGDLTTLGLGPGCRSHVPMDLGRTGAPEPHPDNLTAAAGEAYKPQTKTRGAQRDSTDLVLRDAPEVIGPEG